MASYRSDSLLDKVKESVGEALPHNDKDRKRAIAVGGLALVLVVVAFFMIARSFSGGDAGAASVSRVMIDGETGEVFESYKIAEGMVYPYENKKTGKKTLYPAEKCHWTKDGKAKIEPTYVLLNEYVGKPGPTICPDCGKPVRAHNPLPPSNLFPQN